METNLSSWTSARPPKLPLAAFFFHTFTWKLNTSTSLAKANVSLDCATVDLLLSNFAEDVIFVRWVHEQEVRFFFFSSPSETPIRSGGDCVRCFERSSTRSNLRFSRNAKHLLERSGSEGQILRSEYEIASVDSFRGKCERSIGKVLVLACERHSFLWSGIFNSWSTRIKMTSS